MILTKSQIQSVENKLRELVPDLQMIYLFGSGVTKDFTDKSDVDLAVVALDSAWEKNSWTIVGELSNIVNRDVDLVNLRSTDTVHQMEIVGKGQLLFHTNDVDAFENRIYQLYLSLNEDRKEILEGIESDLSVYG